MPGAHLFDACGGEWHESIGDALQAIDRCLPRASTAGARAAAVAASA